MKSSFQDKTDRSLGSCWIQSAIMRVSPAQTGPYHICSYHPLQQVETILGILSQDNMNEFQFTTCHPYSYGISHIPLVSCRTAHEDALVCSPSCTRDLLHVDSFLVNNTTTTTTIAFSLGCDLSSWWLWAEPRASSTSFVVQAKSLWALLIFPVPYCCLTTRTLQSTL